MTEIHISDIRQFRQCRRAWDWGSRFRRNLEPAVPYPPFYTGRLIHSALEHYYRDGTPLLDTLTAELKGAATNLWPQEVLTFDEQEALMHNILLHYDMWIALDKKMYSDANLEFISLEREFRVPLPTPSGRRAKGLMLGGRFDGIVRHKGTGEYWIWETKTTRSIKELVSSLAHDEQCGVYMYAASKALGVPVVGVLYNIIRKKAPTRPAVLKSGLLSKAVNVDTTAFFYLNCIREMYPDWTAETIAEFFGDTLGALVSNESKFFMRYPVYRSTIEIKNLMRGIYYTAREMKRKSLYLYPSPGWLACTFCAFKSPCLTMNTGGDYEVLLREEYQPREQFTLLEEEDDDSSNGTVVFSNVNRTNTPN